MPLKKQSVRTPKKITPQPATHTYVPVSNNYYEEISSLITTKVDEKNTKKEILDAMKEELMNHPLITDKDWGLPLYFTNGYSTAQLSYSKEKQHFINYTRRRKKLDSTTPKDSLLYWYKHIAFTSALLTRKLSELEQLLEENNLSDKVISKKINTTNIRVTFKEMVKTSLFEVKYHERLGYFADIKAF